MKARILALALLGLALQGCVALDARSPLPQISDEAASQFRRELPEFFGVERLLAFCGARGFEGADALATGILEHVRSWSARAFDDDVTLVVVERGSPRR